MLLALQIEKTLFYVKESSKCVECAAERVMIDPSDRICNTDGNYLFKQQQHSNRIPHAD